MGLFVQKISISKWQTISVNWSVTSFAVSGVVLETQIKTFYKCKYSDFPYHHSILTTADWQKLKTLFMLNFAYIGDFYKRSQVMFEKPTTNKGYLDCAIFELSLWSWAIKTLRIRYGHLKNSKLLSYGLEL